MATADHTTSSPASWGFGEALHEAEKLPVPAPRQHTPPLPQSSEVGLAHAEAGDTHVPAEQLLTVVPISTLHEAEASLPAVSVTAG